MTTSERASEIYQAGGTTWQNAMKQAYEEIARPVIESEYEDKITNLISGLEDLYSGDFEYFERHQQLIIDILEQARDKFKRDYPEKPYQMMWKALKNWAPSLIHKIKTMVYVSKPRNSEFDNLYRDSNGKINSAWFEAVDGLMDALGITSSHYKEW